ncbi:hypothetical protein O0I10_011103 [Lichtheimia ornata]|uniref:Uncharacterized protein n=1 Tax=Lichtheimia ornata TaxID=688661 RepID=A0AAD7XSX7_9FUNG|nr:uncharacterized protein O0I10_011103 [Lichtheimia ornata]KAJ8653255.1 hypothetical protein O0I10_011103 [Lichtheimia ornata]
MGGTKVTYAIGYTNVSSLQVDIRNMRLRAKRLRSEGNEISSARLGIECAELLIEYADQPDSDLSEAKQEEHRENNLSKAIKYAKDGYEVLIRVNNPYRDTIKALELMTDAYRRLKNYDEAIQSNKTLIHRLRDMNDVLELRNATRTLGDIYFERGHEPDSAKYNDFENARVYYLQERNILDQLDPDTEGYPTMKVSLDFNLGVIEAKFVEGLDRGKEYLLDAIKGAHQLGDYEQERKAWWELGNICKKNGDFERAIRCQEKELHLVEKHSNTDEKILCLIEMVKTYLEYGDFDECLKCCNQLNQLVDSEEDENEATSSTKLVVASKSIKDQLDELPGVIDLSTVNVRGNLYFKKARIEFEHFMYKMALASTEKGIHCIDQDPSIKKQLPRLRIALMQLQAELAWRLRELSVDELIALNNEILVEIKIYFTDLTQRLHQLQVVYERMTQIYYYFERKDDYHQWSELLKELEKNYQEDTLDDEDESAHMDYWSTTSFDYAVDTKTIPGFMVSESNKSKSLMEVTVMIPVDGENKGVKVPIDNDIRNIGWLMAKVTELAWEQYGVEPRVNRLQVGSSALSPHEIIVLAINQDMEMEAVVDGYVKKTPVEIYQNVCTRLGLPSLTTVESALRDHQGGVLKLSGAGLSSRDVAAITQVLKRIPPLNTLDLSANLFYDQDVIDILTSTPGIQHLDLKSNRLTHNLIPLLDCRSLLSLDLSFNPLGPESLAKLPQGLEMWPAIKKIKFVYCDIGGYIRITDEIQASYDNAGSNPREDISIDLTDNAFSNLMRAHWQPLLEKLVCHSNQIEMLFSVFSRIPLRVYAIVAEILLVLSSAALMAVDLTYGGVTPYRVRYVDIYVYAAIAGVIGLWTLVYGLYFTLRANRHGIRMYLYFLICLVALSIIIGIIHIILTFTLYRNSIIHNCVDDTTNGLFWWSFGYEFDSEVAHVVDLCTKLWARYTVQRTLTWAVYSIVIVFAAWFVNRYYRSLERRALIEYEDYQNSDGEDRETKMVGPETKLVIHEANDDHDHDDDDDDDQEQPPNYEDVANVQHEQRQRLYDEIHKVHNRRRTEASVHPLDPPSATHQRPTSIYGSGVNTQQGTTQPRPSECSEKLDYNWYRSQQTLRRPSNLVDEDLGLADTGAESRRRPTSWRKQSSDKTAQ